LHNYQIETLSRIGNRFIVKDTVDLTNFFGVAGGVATTQNPQSDIVPLTGDYSETSFLSGVINNLKYEVQQLTGTITPLSGVSTTGNPKTATEIQMGFENSINMNREVIEHLVTCGIQPILEHLVLLAATLQAKPVTLRKPSSDSVHDQFKEISLEGLTLDEYSVEMVTTNPGISKYSQSDNLLRLMDIMLKHEGKLSVIQPFLQQLGHLWGIKDIKPLLQHVSNTNTPS
jgi:hypothetical protein